jgi:hypothetical protein
MPPQILERAIGKLVSLREQVIKQCRKPWVLPGHGPGRWIEELQENTGLGLDFDETYCEIIYKAVAESNTDHPLPTRMIALKAKMLDRPYANIENSADELVKYYLDNLPPPQTEDILDILGQYIPENGIFGVRIEIYWARIAAYCIQNPTLTPSAVSAVVLIHELAHYVTHMGDDGEGHWADFSNRDHDVVEIVAQVATEEILENMANNELMEAFDELLKAQPRRYIEHRKIRKEIWNAYRAEKGDCSPDHFWHYFNQVIKKNSDPAKDTIRGIHQSIGEVKATIDLDLEAN